MATKIPQHFWVDKKITHDNSTAKANVFEIKNANTDTITTLNKGSSTFHFSYKGENKFYRLGSNRSGFRMIVSFRTQTPVNTNESTANTTLASNFAMYLFQKADFFLAGQLIESVQNVGTVTDILFHTKGTEWREHIGRLAGFIPDTSSAADDNPISHFKFNAAPANIGATADSSAVTTVPNVNYNEGYHKRKTLYNYTIANDNIIREIEVFIPLSAIFGFCSDYDRVLKFINFDIDLLRETDSLFHRCVFGAADTTIQIGNDDETGLKSISLEIEEILPSPELVQKMDEYFMKDSIEISFLSRECERHSITDELNISPTKYNIPRYAFFVARGNTGNASQNSATANFQLFRHANIQSVQVYIDSNPYPNLLQNADFNKNKFSRFYQEFLNCSRKLDGDSSLSMEDYKNLYTIFAIDLNAQQEKLKNSGINLSINVKRKEKPDNNDTPINPLNLEIYVLILNEVSYTVQCKNGIVNKLS